MQRPIILRGIDTITKEVVGEVDLSENPIHYPKWFFTRTDEIKLVQYVGKEDKEGNKIFEHDIMNVQMINEFGSIEEKNLFVRFCNNRLAWSLTLDSENECNHVCFDIDTEGKVIGNIHTNKELLK